MSGKRRKIVEQWWIRPKASTAYVKSYSFNFLKRILHEDYRVLVCMLQFSFESWIVDAECLATFLGVTCRLQRCALTRFLVQILYSCWTHVSALDVDLREVGIINFFRTSKGSSLLVQCLLNSKLVCCSLVFCSGLTCIVTACSSLLENSCPCNVTHKLYVE